MSNEEWLRENIKPITMDDLLRLASKVEIPPPKDANDDEDPECQHPVESRAMRGWTQVCTTCGKGREIG